MTTRGRQETIDLSPSTRPVGAAAPANNTIRGASRVLFIDRVLELRRLEEAWASREPHLAILVKSVSAIDFMRLRTHDAQIKQHVGAAAVLRRSRARYPRRGVQVNRTAGHGDA